MNKDDDIAKFTQVMSELISSEPCVNSQNIKITWGKQNKLTDVIDKLLHHLGSQSDKLYRIKQVCKKAKYIDAKANDVECNRQLGRRQLALQIEQILNEEK